MPKAKTLPANDPKLQDAVGRHKRTQQVNGWILIGYGLLTQVIAVSGEPLHPVAGLPFIAIGFFCLVWGDPALLAATGMLFAFAIVPTVNPAIPLLGPDPIVRMAGLSGWEVAIIVIVKAVLAFTSMQQFFLFRLLYGTERMVSDEPNLALIPPLVTNRTDIYARWSRSAGIAAAALAALTVGFVLVDPQALATRFLAELAGALGATALGLGVGAAFSPTDERPAALLGMGAGAAAYLVTAAVLWLVT
jgi:hypothetical protein